MNKGNIIFSGPGFYFQKEINNEYDFEIALETLSNNIHNIINRPVVNVNKDV